MKFGDPQNFDMWLDVNGERDQTGNTHTMIFSVQGLVGYAHSMSLTSRLDDSLSR
jgi:2-keto-4-pentenoate hydratase/2-oxohepta-3-ene-1,7-dioic acid hydratase in catechol pathway